MKKFVYLIVAVVLAIGFAGCSSGIPQEQYDAVVAERDAAVSEADAAKESLTSAEAERDTALADLDAANAKVSELEEKNEGLSEEYLKLFQETQQSPGQSEDELKETAFGIGAKTISENCVVKVLYGDVVEVVYAARTEDMDDIQQKIQDNVWALNAVLESYEDVQSCIIMVVNEQGKCVFGYSLHSDGSVEPFLSQLYS